MIDGGIILSVRNHVTILISYLLCSFLPPIALVVSGWIEAEENCGQCRALLLVGSLLILGMLLLVHVVQFLGLVQLKNRLLDIILMIGCSFSSTLIWLFSLLMEFMEDGEIQSDWRFLLVPGIVNFLLGFYAYRVLARIHNESTN